MLVCAKCGKQFEKAKNYSYGLDCGKVFCYHLCDDCIKTVTDEERTVLKNKSIEEFEKSNAK